MSASLKCGEHRRLVLGRRPGRSVAMRWRRGDSFRQSLALAGGSGGPPLASAQARVPAPRPRCDGGRGRAFALAGLPRVWRPCGAAGASLWPGSGKLLRPRPALAWLASGSTRRFVRLWPALCWRGGGSRAVVPVAAVHRSPPPTRPDLHLFAGGGGRADSCPPLPPCLRTVVLSVSSSKSALVPFSRCRRRRRAIGRMPEVMDSPIASTLTSRRGMAVGIRGLKAAWRRALCFGLWQLHGEDAHRGRGGGHGRPA